MPTILDPIQGYSSTLVTGIYIARGDDTLGPYTSEQAAALVHGGELLPTDHAARNGDAAWVPLAEFLPSDFSSSAEPTSAVAQPVVPGREAHPHRWRRLTVAFAVFLAAPLLVAGSARWWENRHAVVERPNVQAPPPAAAPTSPPLPPVAAEIRPVAPPATAQTGGPVRGSISLTEGGRTALAGIRVKAYRLDTLEASLAPAAAAARIARERLDPQIDAAGTERSARAVEEQTALQAWRDAPPADPMRPSLRFAYTGARSATRTAEENSRYLLDERTAAAGGEVFLRDLPAPAATAETDEAGDFALELPADDASYAVVASARPATDEGSVRPRYWFVKLSPAQRSGREPLRLDADNFTSSAADASLVHTAD